MSQRLRGPTLHTSLPTRHMMKQTARLYSRNDQDVKHDPSRLSPASARTSNWKTQSSNAFHNHRSLEWRHVMLQYIESHPQARLTRKRRSTHTRETQEDAGTSRLRGRRGCERRRGKTSRPSYCIPLQMEMQMQMYLERTPRPCPTAF
jgi:hypothetical protein